MTPRHEPSTWWFTMWHLWSSMISDRGQGKMDFSSAWT